MKMIKIEKDGDLLRINKDGLLQIIGMNPDKKSSEIDNGLINLIENYYGRFTVKQTAWIFQKVGFIIRVNKTLGSLKGFKDIDFI
jgi:hypothetical protein